MLLMFLLMLLLMMLLLLLLLLRTYNISKQLMYKMLNTDLITLVLQPIYKTLD